MIYDHKINKNRFLFLILSLAMVNKKKEKIPILLEIVQKPQLSFIT